MDHIDHSYVFVFQKFLGEAFAAIVKTKATIYGPTVLETIVSGKINAMVTPLYNFNLSQMVVSVAGVPVEIRNNIIRKIRSMDGTATEMITPSTTHFLSLSVRSPEYMVHSDISFNDW